MKKSAEAQLYALELQIREEILKATESMTDSELAKKIGALPIGASMLRERTYWPLEKSIMIASQLGFKVSIKLEK